MTSELDNYRRQIDTFDDQIIRLLKDRLGVVKKVGEFKRETAPDLFPIRPAREASMIRRIAEAFQGSDFSPAAAAHIWRIIIGTSTALEANLTVSVLASATEPDYFWLAREYFGPVATIIKQPHINRVIADVVEGAASIGVVPVFSHEETSGWWTNLMHAASPPPKIFAHLPFTYTNEKPKNFPAAMAFSRLIPEASGEDISLYVLEVDHDVSQNRLQTALGAENFTPTWISIASAAPNVRHHLIELKGFVTPENKSFQKFLATLGATVRHSHFLGAYAVPFTIKA